MSDKVVICKNIFFLLLLFNILQFLIMSFLVSGDIVLLAADIGVLQLIKKADN